VCRYGHEAVRPTARYRKNFPHIERAVVPKTVTHSVPSLGASPTCPRLPPPAVRPSRRRGRSARRACAAPARCRTSERSPDCASGLAGPGRQCRWARSDSPCSSQKFHPGRELCTGLTVRCRAVDPALTCSNHCEGLPECVGVGHREDAERVGSGLGDAELYRKRLVVLFRLAVDGQITGQRHLADVCRRVPTQLRLSPRARRTARRDGVVSVPSPPCSLRVTARNLS